MSEKKKYFEIVAENIDKVPTGKGKVKSDFWDNIIKDFFASGKRNWKLKWIATKPSFTTARSSLLKLTRGEGKKKDNTTIIPAGNYHSQAEISVVKDTDGVNYLYFVNVEKQKEWDETQSVGKLKKGKK